MILTPGYIVQKFRQNFSQNVDFRGRVAFRNGGPGSSFTQPCANRYSNFSKCTLRFSLAQANLFAIFTVFRTSVIDLWQCISRQLFRRCCFMVPLRWFLRFTFETEYAANFYAALAMFSAPKRGVLCPPKFCSWGLRKPPPPCSAAYEFKL